VVDIVLLRLSWLQLEQKMPLQYLSTHPSALTPLVVAQPEAGHGKMVCVETHVMKYSYQLIDETNIELGSPSRVGLGSALTPFPLWQEGFAKGHDFIE
jgi:hypothetical protein